MVHEKIGSDIEVLVELTEAEEADLIALEAKGVRASIPIKMYGNREYVPISWLLKQRDRCQTFLSLPPVVDPDKASKPDGEKGTG